MKLHKWLIFVGALSIFGVVFSQSAAWAATASEKDSELGAELSHANGQNNAASEESGDAQNASKQPEANTDKPAELEKTGESTATDSSESKEPAVIEPPKKPASLLKIRRELSKNETELRDRLRQTLVAYRKQPFNTRQNTVGDIMGFCLPYGCDTEITLYDSSGERRANGITCLCWNASMAGYEPLMMFEGRITARLGYGVQSHPSQLLAVLAFARVQANYPLRAGNTVRTVADLIESEKLSCRSGADLSLKLIGLSYYADDESWKNDRDEDWTLEKIVREELNRPSPNLPNANLNRLMGLAYANYHREKRSLPLGGQYARSDKYLTNFHKFTLNLQNSDGSWGYFLSARGVNKNSADQLRSTSYVFEWLSLSLPENELSDSRLTAAANYVLQGLNAQRNYTNTPGLPSRDIDSIAHALHGLAIYNDRFFASSDGPKPAAEDPAVGPSAAKRGTNAAESR